MSVFSYKKPEAKRGMGFYSKLDQHDIIDRVPDMFGSGYKVTERNTIRPIVHGVGHNTPWCHQQHAPNMDCGLWHYVMFNHWRWFVPSKCQNCYKVVVSPRTVSELFKLKELQEGVSWPSKCGIEVREYTPKLYGGYFYNWGLENGKRRYEQVREAVNDMISPDCPVVLKRACTEYEMELGKSESWIVTRDQLYIEKLVEDTFETRTGQSPQPEMVKTHTQRMWIHWAFSAGDSTYKEFTDGKPLYPEYTFYHDKTLEECENLLATGKAVAYGEDLEKLNQLGVDLEGVTQKNKANADQVALALNLKNPIITGEADIYF